MREMMDFVLVPLRHEDAKKKQIKRLLTKLYKKNPVYF